MNPTERAYIDLKHATNDMLGAAMVLMSAMTAYRSATPADTKENRQLAAAVRKAAEEAAFLAVNLEKNQVMISLYETFKAED